MPRKSKSFASTLNNWKVMMGGYEKHGQDMAFATGDAGKLKELASQAEALNVRQEQLKAELAKTTEELNVSITEGGKIYASLLRFAQGKYGPSSKEIKDFKPTGEA